MGEMIGSGLRKKIGEILIRQPELLILTLRVIIVFMLVVVLRHRVPSLTSVELSQAYPILLVDFVDSFIVGIVKRGGICVLIVVSLITCIITCSGIIL